jgi:hypothetical protein
MAPAVVAMASSGSTSTTSAGQNRITVHRHVLTLLRIVGVGLLVAMAWIHFYLWLNGGYRSITPIGPLFLLNAIGGLVLAVALLVVPLRLLTVTTALSTLFMAGTLGALLLSLTSAGLFGFQESTLAPLVPATLWVESAGVVALVLLTVGAWLNEGWGSLRKRSNA